MEARQPHWISPVWTVVAPRTRNRRRWRRRRGRMAGFACAACFRARLEESLNVWFTNFFFIAVACPAVPLSARAFVVTIFKVGIVFARLAARSFALLACLRAICNELLEGSSIECAEFAAFAEIRIACKESPAPARATIGLICILGIVLALSKPVPGRRCGWHGWHGWRGRRRRRGWRRW